MSKKIRLFSLSFSIFPNQSFLAIIQQKQEQRSFLTNHMDNPHYQLEKTHQQRYNVFMSWSIKGLSINGANEFLRGIDDTRILSLYIMRLFFIILTLSIFYSSSSMADSTNEAIKINHFVKPLIITIGSRMLNKIPSPDPGFCELNIEAGYYPIMIGDATDTFAGINVGYAQARSQIYNLNKIGIGLSSLGISFGFGRGTIWLYSNEFKKAEQAYYFNSLAFELDGGMGIDAGFGIEISQFDYVELKQGNGILAKSYFKLGLSGILLL